MLNAFCCVFGLIMLNVTRESKAFQGPWTTLVKGRGLGANTKSFDIGEAKHINHVLAIVERLAGNNNRHNEFSKAVWIAALYVTPLFL